MKEIESTQERYVYKVRRHLIESDPGRFLTTGDGGQCTVLSEQGCHSYIQMYHVIDLRVKAAKELVGAAVYWEEKCYIFIKAVNKA